MHSGKLQKLKALNAKLVSMFSFSWADLWKTLLILLCAVLICAVLRQMDPEAGFAAPVFVLAVLLTSRFTTGYLFGLLSAVLGVFGVNYFFTFPFWAFNFTISGYPLSTLTLLTVSIITCTLTTQARQKETLRLENEKVKMRANLLRSVSHDIRTPLTSIVGSTSAVLDNPDLSAEAQRILLQDAKHEAEWLIRVVENLLSITRIGSEYTSITTHPEAVEEVLAEVLQKGRKHFPGISFSVEVPDDLLMVPMDPILIEQVLFNLIENAVIHGKTTSHIKISVHADRESAFFEIKNNGLPIAPDRLAHLFDGTLSHSDSPLGDEKRNMGLGLSVCTAIISAHGGTLQAENLSDGVRFSFCLPLSKEDS